MKKLFTFLAMSSILFLYSADLSAEPAKVLISSSKGATTVVRDGKSIDAAEGFKLQAGDIVKTSPEAQVDIGWKGKWGYRLLGSSVCELSSIEKKDAKIKMEKGDIIVNVKKLPEGGKLEVVTPTAIAGVRGTQFWGRVLGIITTFAVRKGLVDINIPSIGEIFTLEGGKALDAEPGKDPIVRDAKPGEMEAMEQADDIGLDFIPDFGDSQAFIDSILSGDLDPPVDGRDIHADGVGREGEGAKSDSHP